MARLRKIEPFLLVVADRDTKTFSIHGPMTDDTPWIKRVVAAQNEGRGVNCHTPGSKVRDEVARAMRAQFGLNEVHSVPLPN